MNRRERALTALEMREPDTVPIWELGIDGPHVEALTGRRWIGSSKETTLDRRGIDRHNVEVKVLCYNKLGFEMIREGTSAADDWKPQTFPDGTVSDEWGILRIYDSRAKTWFPFRTMIKTPEDFKRFTLPDPHAPGRLYAFEYLVKLAKEDVAIAGQVRSPFANAWEVFGPQNFSQWLHERPQFIKRVIAKMTDYAVDLIEAMADAGADLILDNGDIAEKNGPMLPLRYFDSIIFPSMRRELRAAHTKGIKFIKHTDGNINPILPGLAKVVDGLHSLDPTAGVDLEEVKKRYGDRLVLMGNVAVDSLCRKGKDEVVEETKACIREAAPGGGYFLTSSNSWYADARLENCLAMVETGRKYGKYPIRV